MKPINFLFKRTNAHNIIVFNTILWTSSFAILLFLFAGDSTPSEIDFIYTATFVFSLILPVSLNLYWLIPRFLKKEKYGQFIVCFLINLILFSEINPRLFETIVNHFFVDYFFISYHNQLDIYFIFLVFFVLTTLLKLAEDWVYLNQIENKALKIQNQQIEHQLYYLKGQINPHFLFNSLNVLYSLAIDKKEEITNAILQLSDILRYVIYDLDSQKITIDQEINLINNYINFEKNRHVKNSQINFIHDVDENIEIHPMLLLPLLENSFKHGLKSGVKNPYIKVLLVVKNNVLQFSITNNYLNFKSDNNAENNGIGLKNIQENLSIIYPKNHDFRIDKQDAVFKVTLEINLKK